MDYEGSPVCLWEDVMWHPKLEQPLIDKLVEFANPQNQYQDGLRGTATKVLDNYGLDVERKSVGSPDTVVPVWRSAAIFWRNTVSLLMLKANGFKSQEDQEGQPILLRPMATHIEPPHSLPVELEEA